MDASARHILTADAPYLANLAALWSVDPRLAAEIDATHATPSYPTQASKAGPPTIAVTTADGKSLQLHSRHQPLEEGLRWADAAPVAEKTAFYVHGFGLGYHVEALFERAGEEALFCVFEADLLLLRTAFELRDYSKLIESRRVLFFTRLDKVDVFDRLTPHTAALFVGVDTVEHRPSVQTAPQFYAQMRLWVDEFASFARTNLNTLVINGRRTAENIAANLGWYAATPSIDRLAGRHAGKPAVIVSAGPSLRKNKHLLKDLTDRAVLVAVQTTLQPLLEMGVEPHYVTSLDYHEICTRFFEKLPPTLKTELVAEPKATSAIFEMYPGPVSLLGSDFADALLAPHGPPKARLASGATVAHLAFYLAQHLGCDPIIFVGQDLGFSDGLCYTPGTSYEDVWRPELGRFCSVEMKQWDQIVRERFILRRIPDHEGRPMYTEERLFSYLQQFERDFTMSPARVIDATEGGAAKRGAESMKLADAIERFCQEPLPEPQNEHPGVRWEDVERCADALAARRDEAAEIERISRETLCLLQQLRDSLQDVRRANELIHRLDTLRTEMNRHGACYDLVMQLTQRSELARFKADRRIAAARLDPAERQRRQVERDIANAAAVVDAAEAFQTLIGQSIRRLTADARRFAPPIAKREAA